MSNRSIARAAHLVVLALALALVALVPRAARAATNVTGGNVINQTWTPAGSPYIVSGDVTVPEGAFLTIQAGTVVQFANGDAQAAGLDSARTEITAKGQLNVNGTAASPVTFAAQSGSGAGIWYGIVVESTGVATIANATMTNASYAIRSSATAMGLAVSNTVINSSTYGAYLEAGTPTLTNVEANGGSYGFYVTGATSATVSGCAAKNNSSAGIYVVPSSGTTTNSFAGCLVQGSGTYGVRTGASSGATSTVNVTDSTLHGNGTYGVYVFAATGGSTTVNVKSSNVTGLASSPQQYGIYRVTANGTTAVTTTYSNVWGSSSADYSSAAAGTGCFSANPLYVSVPTNMRLTSNSPSRFAGDAGGDLGPLDYTNDATPGYHGTLWVNTTLTLAGSPYTLAGDMTVGPSAKLTIEPGVVVNFSNGDLMGSGDDTARGEIRVNGTLDALGTSASPITLRATTVGAGNWYGVVVPSTSKGATLTNVNLQYGSYAVRSAANGSLLSLTNVASDSSTYGVYLEAGTPTLTNVTANNGSYGFYVTGATSATVSGCTSKNNTSAGIYVVPSSGITTNSFTGCLVQGSGTYGVRTGASSGATSTVNITDSTLHGNGTYGVYVFAATGGSTTVNVKSSNVTGLASSPQQYGIYRVTANGTTAVTTTYSNVWGSSSADYSSAAAGTGCFSANPLYVSVPTNMRLTSNSPSRFAGDAGGDLGPLDYTNDATPGYHGTLWVNTTLTLAGSPYTIAGDMTVGPSAKLTIEPGVVVNFSNGDLMGSGDDTARGEIRVNGTLDALGTSASPITLRATTVGTGNWYGVVVPSTSKGATLTNVNL
ncbi:beta strand repeat-containing protein, partial [Polyangium jinanense]